MPLELLNFLIWCIRREHAQNFLDAIYATNAEKPGELVRELREFLDDELPEREVIQQRLPVEAGTGGGVPFEIGSKLPPGMAKATLEPGTIAAARKAHAEQEAALDKILQEQGYEAWTAEIQRIMRENEASHA